MCPSPGASCAGPGSKHFSKISAWSTAPGKAQEGQDYKNVFKKIHNIKSLVWLSGFLEALSVPTSFYLSSLKPMIQTESLSNRHRNEDHRNDQVGSELRFINCLWGMRRRQCSVSACGKHSDEPPGASFKSVTAAARVLLRDSLLSKAMPFPGWRTAAMMDQGVSVRASQFQHNSGLLWWNIPAPRLLCGHPRLTLALHCSLISPYIKCPPFSFFGRYLPKGCFYRHPT